MLVAVAVVAFAVAPAGADAPAADRSTARFEVDFLTGMIDHHQMAVDMAEICLDNATHSELTAMCEGIVASQSAQIDQMQSWLQDWYGVSHEPEMTRGAMQQMEQLASESGAEFEIDFMEAMSRHHHKAIVEAQMCLRRAYHGELLDLCQNIIQAQRAEISQMQQWLCQWYDRCRNQYGGAAA